MGFRHRVGACEKSGMVTIKHNAHVLSSPCTSVLHLVLKAILTSRFRRCLHPIFNVVMHHIKLCHSSPSFMLHTPSSASTRSLLWVWPLGLGIPVTHFPSMGHYYPHSSAWYVCHSLPVCHHTVCFPFPQPHLGQLGTCPQFTTPASVGAILPLQLLEAPSSLYSSPLDS